MVKKVFKILDNVFLIVSIAMLFLGALLSFIPRFVGPSGSLGSTLLTMIGSTTIALMVGIFLHYAKNDIARRIGDGLVLAVFLINGITAIGLFISMPAESVIPLQAIINLVATIIFAVHYLMVFVSWIIGKVNKENKTLAPEQDPRIAALKSWKELQNQGIITEDEFQEKRNAILELNKVEEKTK